MELTKEQLNEKIDKFIADNKEAILKDIATLVAVPSVESAPLPGAPFGAEPKKALETALKIGQEMGFTPHNCDDHVGWVEIEGKEKGHIATITHVDVVPAGDGWTADPFVMREREGFIIGRGVADDKGPSILCLYLAKFFKELGMPLRYGLRILLGSAEETGMKDVPYYLERNEEPLFCFSPDSEFPVSFGEKGHFNGTFVSTKFAGNILDFEAGIASNVIPGRATCLLKGEVTGLQNTDHITVETEDGNTRLNAVGIGGHAAHPEGTMNAIALLVDYLLNNNLCTPAENQYLELLKRLHASSTGSGVGVDCSDDIFHALTIVGSMVKCQDGKLYQTMDSRFPTATSVDDLKRKLSEQANEVGATLEEVSGNDPFYIPEDSDVIQALLGVYNEVTGKSAKAFTQGGGTYARCFKKAVSFGPGEPEEVVPGFVGPMHGADEGASIDGLLKGLKIYILTVFKLQEIDL